MKIFILVFILNGSLFHMKYDSYEQCLAEGKNLDSPSYCIENFDGLNFAKNYPYLTK